MIAECPKYVMTKSDMELHLEVAALFYALQASKTKEKRIRREPANERCHCGRS